MSGNDSDVDVSFLSAAVDPEFVRNYDTDFMKGTNQKQKVSNRRTDFSNDEFEYFNSLGITPDFGRRVAKILSKHLEGQIKVFGMKSSSKDEEEEEEEAKSDGEESGIRLFASSREVLVFEAETKEKQKKKPDLLKMSRKRKSRLSGGSDSEDEESKLASVAVSTDWVLSRNGVY